MGRGEAGALLGLSYGPSQAHRFGGSSLTPSGRGLFQQVEAHAFAHPAEQDLARILSFYRIRWVYEPTTFHLEFREDGRPAEQITPDFYLPDHDLFIELTTMRQRLVTRKNRKIRRLREIFPSIQIKLLYRRDYDRLVGAYPALDHLTDPQLGNVIFDEASVNDRVSALAREIHAWGETLLPIADSASRQRSAPLQLIGVGAGSRRFLLDLAVQLDQHDCCVSTDQLIMSRYDGSQADARVRVGQELKTPVAGRDVLLVADIVSSGLSLIFVTDWLRSRGARSVRICALLDRRDARIIDIPLDFVGFEAPDEVLVGYGLSSYPRFQALSHIASIHEREELAELL